MIATRINSREEAIALLLSIEEKSEVAWYSGDLPSAFIPPQEACWLVLGRFLRYHVSLTFTCSAELDVGAIVVSNQAMVVSNQAFLAVCIAICPREKAEVE